MGENIRHLVKECVSQVLRDELLNEGFDPTSVGPNPAASEGLPVENPYPEWNKKMQHMEEENNSFGNAFADNWDESDRKALKKNYPYGSQNARMRTMDEYSPNEENPNLDVVGGALPPLPQHRVPDSSDIVPENPSELPLSGEKKYYKQEPGGTMMAVNATSLANESQGGMSIQHDYQSDIDKMRKMEELSPNPHGRYSQEAGASVFDPRYFGPNEGRVNPDGPMPTNYHDKMEWLSLRAGRPLPVPGSSTNALPTNYHDRMETLRYYATRGKEGKSHRHDEVKALSEQSKKLLRKMLC